MAVLTRAAGYVIVYKKKNRKKAKAMTTTQRKKDSEEGTRNIHIEIGTGIGGFLFAYLLGIFTPEEYRVRIVDFVLKLLTPVIEFFKGIFG